MVDDEVKIAAKNEFTLYIEGKKMRKTPERYAILDKILSINEHFDIEMLYRLLENDSYHVSRATVYNTIELLMDAGIVRRIRFDNQQAKYELACNHHHLICTECGKIKEVKDQDFIAYMNALKYPSFTMSYFQLYVYGICNSCVRKKKRRQKKEKI